MYSSGSLRSLALHVAQGAEQALLKPACYLLSLTPHLDKWLASATNSCSTSDPGSHNGGASRGVIIRDGLAAIHPSLPNRKIIGCIHDINGSSYTADHYSLLSRTFNCSIFSCLSDLQAHRRVNASVTRNGSEVVHEPYRWALRRHCNWVSLFSSSISPRPNFHIPSLSLTAAYLPPPGGRRFALSRLLYG